MTIKEFDKQLQSRKLSNALKGLSNSNKSGVLQLNKKADDKKVLDDLREKHSAPEETKSSYVINQSE